MVAPANAASARVGAIFSGSVSVSNHFCTASVIHSAHRNLLLTAAHCLSRVGNAVFAPGYRDVLPLRHLADHPSVHHWWVEPERRL